MRYEKKMLILSGDGKGVVMIERSAYGVKFALRTFDIEGDALKVGIVTPSSVIVRDIPSGKNPSAVFYIDDTELDSLHFAVFDRELILYGATCKKMWEANLMDILRKHDVAVSAAPSVPAPQKLPPIAQKPDKLPLPDGTGLPQSRAAIYGDDALADSDFYTPFDLAPRMTQVDSFLDSPRILDGLSPEIDRRLSNPSIPAAAFDAEAAAAIQPETPPSVEEPAPQETTAIRDEAQEDEAEEKPEDNEIEASAMSETTAEQTPRSDEHVADDRAAISEDPKPTRAIETEKKEVAAAEDQTAVGGSMPWMLQAKYLSGRSTREPIQDQPRTAAKLKQKTDIPKLREATFFERSRQDVEKLFETASPDGELSALLPDLKWVKVKFDGHAVSVGRDASVLCYAVGGLYEKISPFGDKAQWLPKLKNAPTGKGYWLIFQDLASGDIIGAV